MTKIKKENNLMILSRCRYHMLQLAKELAAATNRQRTPAERNNVTCQNECLCGVCVCVMSRVKLIMLV